LDQISDSVWAERFKEGDQAAFKLLFRKHAGWIHSKAYRILRNHEDAEEACQDVFTKVWLKINLWDSEQGSFQTWLNEIAKNTIIDMLRKKKRRKAENLSNWINEEKKETLIDLAPDHRPTSDSQIEGKEAFELIEEALQEVRRDDHRIAWILRHIEFLSIAEISKAMGEKQNTVKVWIFRCSGELKRILTAKGIQL
jgi:RNA polymerase sigma-70 factor (ECF subfamily)